MRILGYTNHGGTLDVAGMLFANQSTWAHVLLAIAEALDLEIADLLTAEELGVIGREENPSVLFV